MVSFTKLVAAVTAVCVTVSAIPIEADGIEFLDDGDDLDLDLGPGLSLNSTGVDGGPSFAAAASRTGDLTYYAPGLGACGKVNGENDAVVALSRVIFDPQTPGGNPNRNPLCGRRIRISRGGKSVDVRVQDRCEGCKRNDLDVPVKVFRKLANQSAGRVKVNWDYL